MKKYIGFLISVTLIALVYASYRKEANLYIYNLTHYSVCEKPLKYKVAQIDDNFEISKEDFKKEAQLAAEIWNKEYPTKLLEYDPNAELTINLVYDERQKLIGDIDSKKDDLEGSDKDIQGQILEYERKFSNVTKKVQELNNEINKWNTEGGAPPSVYEDLIDKQGNLNSEIATLNQEAVRINKLAEQYNIKVDEFNSTVQTFNKSLAGKPEQGLYIGPENKIEIYFYKDDAEFMHTLAHEFGHALGVREHIKNEVSIMSEFTNTKLELSSADVLVLKDLCKQRNIFVELQQQLKNISYNK
ncbi:matrixin family metalloprotease [candidate division WWE3 bacterium]|uniref:Matrixin family metalloprotease n=1 Tax=candidate division WWE3 bacterium TaxID=2053526 RepID=A0A955ECQ5_UNCKA|nr:matrixin family metalloprotease [candidate division WWE3 bacterium]